MSQHELFKFLFPGDQLAKLISSQPSPLKCMQALENQLKPPVMKEGQVLSEVNHHPDHIYFSTRKTIDHAFPKNDLASLLGMSSAAFIRG